MNRAVQCSRHSHDTGSDLADIDDLVGTSSAIRSVVRQVRTVASTTANVLILGECGSGREPMARALHRRSPRGAGPFVAVNCAAIREARLEAELFGSVGSAVTGSDRGRTGLIEESARGTLFLDEVGDIPLTVQATLLRAIQARRVRRVGGHEDHVVDFRLVSATNADIADRIQQGRFREDLFDRLAVITIRLPTLRERPQDIPLLARHLVARSAHQRPGRSVPEFTADATERLCSHRWPGNVRELQSVVERAAVLCRGPYIGASDLVFQTEVAAWPGHGARPTLAELERQYAEQVLREAGGNKAQAAHILGISTRTLQRRFRGA